MSGPLVLVVATTVLTMCVCACRTSESETQSDKAARLLGALRAGVEHLAEKVQPLKTVSPSPSPFPSTACTHTM